MGQKQDLEKLSLMNDATYQTELKAKAGDAESQYACYMLYKTGAAVPKNEKKALAYLRQAAAQDYMQSRQILASYEAYKKTKAATKK